jgi:hypothetical protein
LEAIEIRVTVGIREESPLLVNAALRDVVRRSQGQQRAQIPPIYLESGAGRRFPLSSYHFRPRSSQTTTRDQCTNLSRLFNSRRILLNTKCKAATGHSNGIKDETQTIASRPEYTSDL